MNTQAIAAEMRGALSERRQLAPFSGRIEGFDSTAAYEVARLIHEARVRAGDRPVGRKIGFSNRDLWPQFQIHEPVWGYLCESTVSHLAAQGAPFSIGQLLEPRIEPEIVVHFGTTPPRRADPAAILASIDWIAHGFEIVESVFPGWKFQAADTVAACALHAALLIGEPQSPARLGADLAGRLARFTVSLACNGAVVDRGRGSNVLGSPLEALAHLIAVLEAQPGAQPLAAGELVTTGTLTGAPLIRPGEVWSTAIDGLALTGLSLKLAA
jgi:2-oxo-3-hexenedioate decarboxylase